MSPVHQWKYKNKYHRKEYESVSERGINRLGEKRRRAPSSRLLHSIAMKCGDSELSGEAAVFHARIVVANRHA